MSLSRQVRNVLGVPAMGSLLLVAVACGGAEAEPAVDEAAPADMAARFRNVAARCMSPEPADRPDAGWVLAELEALHSEATAANVYGTPPCGDHDDDVPEE